MKKLNINIFGSTGTIGIKTLNLIEKNFKNININLLVADSNYNLLIKQIKKFRPKFVFLNNNQYTYKLYKHINKKKIFFEFSQLIKYLLNSKSEYTILAISGYKSLYYLESIILNTNNLGIVNKESIVSAGHIFKKKNYFKKTKIYPIDSEHFSLYEYLKSSNIKNTDINKVIITASGGPFYKSKFKHLQNITFKQAIKHPKWKMGYKNSIDSATMVNKCLEIIEAHYLFNLPYKNIDVLIHPEAIIHSIIEKNNYVSHMNLFKNDMNIPIFNFLNQNRSKTSDSINLHIKSFKKYSFFKINYDNFPIYKFFLKLDKEDPANLIKFNIGNQYAVDLFKQNLIKYTDIFTIIKKVSALNLYSSLNNIKDIINFHEDVEKNIKQIFKDKF